MQDHQQHIYLGEPEEDLIESPEPDQLVVEMDKPVSRRHLRDRRPLGSPRLPANHHGDGHLRVRGRCHQHPSIDAHRAAECRKAKHDPAGSALRGTTARGSPTTNRARYGGG